MLFPIFNYIKHEKYIFIDFIGITDDGSSFL